MIQLRSILNVADNSGVLSVKFIYSLNKATTANIGDEIVVTVKQVVPVSHQSISYNKKRIIQKGTILRAIVIRTKKGIIRPNGMILRFQDNAVVLYSKNTGNLLANKILGPVPRELRANGRLKLLSQAQYII